MIIDFADFNVKLMISYSLLLITGLLMYIAFFKKAPSKQK